MAELTLLARSSFGINNHACMIIPFLTRACSIISSVMVKKLKFPDGFYWGASTSAHQVEGGNKNDWSEWEKENAGRLAREAKDYWQPWQVKEFPEMLKKKNYISGKAVDHYNRFESDFDIAKSLGHNAHRFSIEWSRIEPEEGKFDEKELGHYQDMITALRKRDIEPFVSLHHFTNPAWFADKGGWSNENSPELFLKYVRYVVENLRDVQYWITINEPINFTFMASLGVGPWADWPYSEKNYAKGYRIAKNFVAAHKKAFIMIKCTDSDALVGISKSNAYFDAYNNRMVSRWVANVAGYIRNTWFLDEITSHQDFVGINYYNHNRIRTGFSHPEKWFSHNENKEVTDFGFEIYPEGIYHVVSEVKRYKKPIYILENGTADADDDHREMYIKEHLRWLHKAIDDGADVRGYFYWSFLDNFEWSAGFWPRFGLVEIDYAHDLKRKVRGSAKEYTKIIKANAVEDSL